jgi:predicted phage terminase large subunit-like protein
METLLTKISNEASQFWKRSEEKNSLSKGTIRQISLFDLAFFSKFFFPELCYYNFNQFHHDYFIFKSLNINRDIKQRKGIRGVFCAPRDSAKSTIISTIDVIHDIIFGLEKYIVIFSATEPQVIKRITNIKHQLISNPILKRYFKLKGNPRFWTGHKIIVNDICIEGYSAGSEVLGITFEEYRPTKIILDDSEDFKKVDVPDQRDKKEDWFKEVVEELGANYTNILAVGTKLHQEGLIAKFLERPDFQHNFYQSILKWNENQSLWDEWKQIYINLDNSNRIEDARAFFEKHKKVMLKGTEVFWEESEDYYTLQTKLITQGRKAFFKNKQNDPRQSEKTVFNLDEIDYFEIKDNAIHRDDGKIIPLKDLFIYGFYDPSVCDIKKGKDPDYPAIATMGKDGHNNLYLLDCWFEHCSPTKQLEMIFNLNDIFHYNLFGIETNNFQKILLEPFKTIQQKRMAQGQSYQIAINEINHSSNKIARIEAIEPLISNRWLKFNRNLKQEFYSLMEQFPTAKYDDPLDAVEGAVQLSRTSIITIEETEENFLRINR